MRNHVFVSVCLPLFLGFLSMAEAPAAVAGDAGFVAMSYNIRAGSGGKDWKVFGFDVPYVGKGDEYLDQVAGVARQYQVDVLCLQECEGRSVTSLGMDQARHIAKELGFNHVWKQSKSVGRLVKRQGNAVVSRWPIKDVRMHQLNDGRDGVETRMALAARVAFPAAGEGGVWVVSTHVDHSTQLIAEGQMKELNGFVASLPGPLVVAGDFNMTPDNPLIVAVLKDAFGRGMLDTTAADGGTNELSSPAKAPRKRIDYVFCSSADFNVVEGSVPRVEEKKRKLPGFIKFAAAAVSPVGAFLIDKLKPVRSEGSGISDHLPVLARLTWQGSASTSTPAVAAGGSDPVAPAEGQVSLLGRQTVSAGAGGGGGGAF